MIFTTVTKDELEKLTELAYGTCVEIGSYLGASACAIAKSADKLYCIDIWESDTKMRPDPSNGTLYDNFLENTKKYDNIIPLRDYSKNIVYFFIKNNIKIDFLFIDGDHTPEGIQTDWNCYYPLVTGIIAFHDYAWPSIRELVHRQVKSGKLKDLTSTINMCWGKT